MTRARIGRDEWWPVPHIDYDGYEAVEIPEDICLRFEAALEEFASAAQSLTQAAAAAGDEYWQTHRPGL